MGAAIALYSATCFAYGKFGNGHPYPIVLRAVVGLSGWLPGARSAFWVLMKPNVAWNMISPLLLLLQEPEEKDGSRIPSGSVPGCMAADFSLPWTQYACNASYFTW